MVGGSEERADVAEVDGCEVGRWRAVVGILVPMGGEVLGPDATRLGVLGVGATEDPSTSTVGCCPDVRKLLTPLTGPEVLFGLFNCFVAGAEAGCAAVGGFVPDAGLVACRVVGGIFVAVGALDSRAVSAAAVACLVEAGEEDVVGTCALAVRAIFECGLDPVCLTPASC